MAARVGGEGEEHDDKLSRLVVSLGEACFIYRIRALCIIASGVYLTAKTGLQSDSHPNPVTIERHLWCHLLQLSPSHCHEIVWGAFVKGLAPQTSHETDVQIIGH